MMILAISVFALSSLGIVILFVLKAWELRTSQVIAPSVRDRVDEQAQEVKQLVQRMQREFRKLPPELIFLARSILHDAAIGAASVARFLERQSHRLADLVSHKRSFERRETQNEFLRNVSEYKNGNGHIDPLDADDQRGHNA